MEKRAFGIKVQCNVKFVKWNKSGFTSFPGPTLIMFYPVCSTFGNDLEPTSHWLEVIFSICIVLSGLMLFTLLIGNIQVNHNFNVRSKHESELLNCITN